MSRIPSPIVLVLVAVTIVLLPIGCSSDRQPIRPVDESLPPNPNGMLLEGAPESPARGALRWLPPSPAAPQDVRDSFLATRLTAVISPNATIGQVNTALESHAARIVSMLPGVPFVSLVVPALADPAGAAALGESLVATGAFLVAYPAFTPVGPRTGVAGIGPPHPPTRITSAVQGGQTADHMVAMRMPAAWNARKLGSGSDKIELLIPGHYYAEGSHPAITAQSFLPGSASSYESGSSQAGNLGYGDCGIAGANAASEGPGLFAGVHPLPDKLSIRSLAVGNFSWLETIMLTDYWATFLDGKIVVCSYQTYDAHVTFDQAAQPYLATQRALDAYANRMVAKAFPTYGSNVLHLVAAGNFGPVAGRAGEACFGSPYALGECYVDLYNNVVVPDDDAPDALKAQFLALWNSEPPPPPQHNLLMVGSSLLDGTEAPLSSRGSDVRVVGDNIPALCIKADDLCNDGTSVVLATTIAAVPQAAGLAAYLWTLAPTRTVEEIRMILEDAFSFGSLPGLIDAYQAVLALDYSIEDPRVRETLLDVNESGLFEEADLQVFLTAFENQLEDPRFDLNGDGAVGGDGVAWFDLDINQPPQFTPVALQFAETTVDFDEKTVTDRDVLCWYAYGSLYVGSDTVRDELLDGCAAESEKSVVEAEFPSIIVAGEPTMITVRASTIGGGGTTYVEGVEIRLWASDGDVEPSNGLTDSNGVLTASVTLDTDENSTRVEVQAQFPDGAYAVTEVQARRPNEIVLSSRRSDAQVWVSSSYRSGTGSDLIIVYDHGVIDEMVDQSGL